MKPGNHYKYFNSVAVITIYSPSRREHAVWRLVAQVSSSASEINFLAPYQSPVSLRKPRTAPYTHHTATLAQQSLRISEIHLVMLLSLRVFDVVQIYLSSLLLGQANY